MANITEITIDGSTIYDIEDTAVRTASRALVTGSDGRLTVSDITSTELNYLDGVTENIATSIAALTSGKSKVEKIWDNSMSFTNNIISATLSNYNALVMTCCSSLNDPTGSTNNNSVLKTILVPCSANMNASYRLSESFMQNFGDDPYLGGLFVRPVTFNTTGIVFGNCTKYYYKDLGLSTSYEVRSTADVQNVLNPLFVIGIKF